MRIQHNIMAMSAYRNYTNNVSAMKKNLEKLSSGYKINRAGDDAAGLAISEKMRAQITGLQTAQKNAKDGISLVQTAEGALTEVHDMLNRMVELATQSANGTYDNDTDRYQLQKEMDQLRAEIDRIADSSNFNGIQLLDGSMDAGGDVVYTSGTFEVTGQHARPNDSAVVLPAVGDVLGTNTVLHAAGVDGNKTNAFSVDLHNLTLAKDGKVEIDIGGQKFTLAAAATDEMSAEEIATKFATSGGFKTSGGANVDPDNVTINGTVYKVEANGTRLTFTQIDGDTSTPTIPKDVKITDPDATPVTPGQATTGGPTAAGPAETQTGDNDNAAIYTYNFAGVTGLSAGSYDVTIGGKTVTVTLTGTPDADALATAVRTALGSETFPDGINGTTSAYTIGGTGSNITFTASNKGTATAITGNITITPSSATSPDSKLTGDYNVETTVISTKQPDAAERLASTKFDLSKIVGDDGKIAEGTQITIGRDTYTFTTDKSKTGKDGYVVFNEGDSLAKQAELLTKAAKDNKTYTVGYNGTTISVTEVPGQNNFDLTTFEGIEKSLGFKKASTNPKDDSKGLTLQIGDTADSFNQLKVNIKDCHVKALGIGNIDISTQDGAAEAVDKIKAAINYVSDVRGTLGATQNRLDHTINNLSVMTENIQDAESTIRDVDIAEEMMAYTKNNILIQSAQAMLAQANQVPQGVLQLLQ